MKRKRQLGDIDDAGLGEEWQMDRFYRENRECDEDSDDGWGEDD